MPAADPVGEPWIIQRLCLADHRRDALSQKMQTTLIGLPVSSVVRPAPLPRVDVLPTLSAVATN